MPTSGSWATPVLKHPNLGPIDEPPYYAVKVLSGTIGTKGGPVTDADGPCPGH